MKRGFFFTLTVISLFSILLLMASNRLLAGSDSAQLLELSLLRRVSYGWDDVNEDAKTAANLSVKVSANNLSVEDFLPAPHDLGRSLTAYGLFLQTHYKTPDINISLHAMDGSMTSFSQLGPPLQVWPYGLNYTYPDYGKNELFVRIPAANFSQVRQVHMNLSLPGHWFKEDVTTSPCSFWSPLKTCGQNTDYCFNYTLRITDKNGTVYANNASCNSFDADQNSNLQLDLNYSGGSNAWVKVLIGKLPDLLDVRLQNANLSANTTFVFNSTDFSLNYNARLRILDPDFNASRTSQLTN